MNDVTGRLIAELEQAGASAEPGAFTIDEDAARRKLAQYRLADPHAWLCQLIEAANLLGATTITIELRAGVLRMEFDGEGIELEGLFGAVFASVGEDPEQRRRSRARRKLALGIDALLGMAKLDSVEITSSSGRLELRPRGTLFGRGRAPGSAAVAREFDASLRASRTRIRVRRATGRWPELDQVRERCRYFPGTLTIDGKPIAFGLAQLLEDHDVRQDRWPIEDGATIGWWGWLPKARAPSMLWLLCDGVLAETIALGGRGGEIAILDAPFRKDIGESKLVRDAEFERLLALIEALRGEHPRPAPHVPAARTSDPEPPKSTPARPKRMLAIPDGRDWTVAEKLVSMLPAFVFYAVLINAMEFVDSLGPSALGMTLVIGSLISLVIGWWLVGLLRSHSR